MHPDKHGRSIDQYPGETDYGRLLGVNAFGNAAYASESTVSLAVLDLADELRVPPRTAWVAHECPLDRLGFDHGEYVRYIAHEHGPWRALTDRTSDALGDRDVDLAEVLLREPADGETVERLVGDLLAADTWTRRAETAGELRMAIMDAPVGDASAVRRLLELLDDVTGASDDATEECGEQPSGRARNFERIAARRDVAFAVDRIARSDPSAVAPSLADVVRLAGDRTYRDPETAYKRSLVDVVVALGRVDPSGVAATFERLFAHGDPSVRERSLRTLTHLERRYVGAEHDLLDEDGLREGVEALTADDAPAVREAAEEVGMIRGMDS